MKILMYILTSFILQNGFGQYQIEMLNSLLINSEKGVVREYNIEYEVINPKKIIKTEKIAITVLRQEALKYTEFPIFYDTYNQIKAIDATIYDGRGKKVKSLSKNNIEDFSILGYNDLNRDDRVKLIELDYASLPCTIVYEVKTTISSSFFPLHFNISPYRDLYIERFTGKISLPINMKINFKSNDLEIKNSTKGKKCDYEFTVENISSKENGHYDDVFPDLLVAQLEDVTLDEYSAKLEGWKSFGNFINKLNQGRSDLPKNLKQKIIELTNSATDTLDKINIIYDYLQKNTRYISIQLGIGGYQPMKASEVQRLGYGDCKALSNYMLSMLNALNIPANYVLIYGGIENKAIDTNFISSQFNHVIVQVPLSQDTIWLECTSQQTPSNYLGYYTGNRYGLVIQENASKLIRTIEYDHLKNVSKRKSYGAINDSGELQVKSTAIHYEGNMEEYLNIELESEAYRKKILQNKYALITDDFKNLSLQNDKSKRSITEEFEINLPFFIKKTGKRIFINPNVFSQQQEVLTEKDKIKLNLNLNKRFTNFDTLEIQIPNDYKIESLPTNKNIVNDYGTYSTEFEMIDDRLIYIRKQEQFGGIYPIENYNGYVTFINEIYKNDRLSAVFVKK